MNQYNPNIHHRRSIRLKGYDYSQAGLYFITICCNRRGNPTWLPFGQIINGEMKLNDAGIMVEKWYNELENKFPDIRCHEKMVMPNHFHCIIENVGIPVGADLRVCPNGPNKPESDNNGPNKPESDNTCPNKPESDDNGPNKPESDNNGPNKPESDNNGPNKPESDDNVSVKSDNNVFENIEGEHVGSPLHCVVQWFKTMTTNEYIRGVKTLGWQPFNRKLWQRNYWEHIIRNEQSYQTISEYIINNPAKWNEDKFYTI